MTSNFTLPPSHFTEDTLVQQTTAEYLRDELGWESVYAYNKETFGPDEPAGPGIGPGGGADPLPSGRSSSN